jgi:hypothetical protein
MTGSARAGQAPIDRHSMIVFVHRSIAIKQALQYLHGYNSTVGDVAGT